MTFRLEPHDGAVLLTLDRPPVNALDLAALLELERAFVDLTRAPPTGGLVLTGAVRAFSAGVDTKAFTAMDLAGRAQLVRAITRMIGALYALPCPVVAAVNGHALGGGFVLMLAADFRLGVDDPSIRLGLTEAAAGVPFPAGALEVIRAELAPELLRLLTLSSLTLSPAEMAARGVLDGLVVPGDLVSAALVRVRDLAKQPAHRQVKQQLRAPIVARLNALAASGGDPMIDAWEAKGDGAG